MTSDKYSIFKQSFVAADAEDAKHFDDKEDKEDLNVSL